MTQRTTTEIAADLSAYRAARTALVNNERVTDVWRDGRRMKMQGLSLAEIESAIETLEREYAQAQSVEAGSSRRRPIRMRYAN